jgi:hypothetical protein
MQGPVRLAYQPPGNSTFLSEQTTHQQPGNNTFLLEQISTSHQLPTKRTGCKSQSDVGSRRDPIQLIFMQKPDQVMDLERISVC